MGSLILVGSLTIGGQKYFDGVNTHATLSVGSTSPTIPTQGQPDTKTVAQDLEERERERTMTNAIAQSELQEDDAHPGSLGRTHAGEEELLREIDSGKVDLYTRLITKWHLVGKSSSGIWEFKSDMSYVYTSDKGTANGYFKIIDEQHIWLKDSKSQAEGVDEFRIENNNLIITTPNGEIITYASQNSIPNNSNAAPNFNSKFVIAKRTYFYDLVGGNFVKRNPESFIIRGDKVIISSTQNGYMNITYTAKNGSIVTGWILSIDLQ